MTEPTEPSYTREDWLSEQNTEAAEIELGDRGRALVDRYRQARDAAQGWERERKKLAGQLMAFMGDGRKGLVNGVHVVTKTVAVRNTFSATRLREYQPDLYTRFCVESDPIESLRLVD